MNPSTTQARVVVDELIRGGVRDVVLCPGSRNAPLAFALDDADRAGRIRLHVRIDERTAGYLAIGLAVAGRRAGLYRDDLGHGGCQSRPGGGGGQLCAGAADRAERQPALRVARHRRQPDHGAAGLLRHPGPRHHQPGPGRGRARADGSPSTRQWRSATCRVLVAATGSRTANAGPVQFDIPLREPLVPDREHDGARPPRTGRPDGKPWTYTPPVTFDQPLDIDLTADTVVIAGHGAGVHPNLADLPTVAEPTAPPAGQPAASARAAAAAPAAGDHAGPPDAAPPGVGAAGRPVGAGVRADHRTALARRLGQLAGHRHPGGHHRARPTRRGCAAAPRSTGKPSRRCAASSSAIR